MKFVVYDKGSLKWLDFRFWLVVTFFMFLVPGMVAAAPSGYVKITGENANEFYLPASLKNPWRCRKFFNGKVQIGKVSDLKDMLYWIKPGILKSKFNKKHSDNKTKFKKYSKQLKSKRAICIAQEPLSSPTIDPPPSNDDNTGDDTDPEVPLDPSPSITPSPPPSTPTPTPTSSPTPDNGAGIWNPGVDAYYPSWGMGQSNEVIYLEYDNNLSLSLNVATLSSKITNLLPGQMLVLQGGVYVLSESLQVTLQGSASLPIWIVGDDLNPPTIIQSDSNAPILTIGQTGQNPTSAKNLIISGLILQGGESALRVHRAERIWIHRNEIGPVGAGIKARTENVDSLFVTGNHIHDTTGYGEGIVFGLDYAHVTNNSIAALNYIHDIQGSSGDGVLIRYGSGNNIVAKNFITRTKFTGIRVYDAPQGSKNVVEYNVVSDSQDNCIQLESGRATVRGNLIYGLAGNKPLDLTHDYNSAAVDVRVEGNTIVTSIPRGVLLGWGVKKPLNPTTPHVPDRLFVNNVVYIHDPQLPNLTEYALAIKSQTEDAILNNEVLIEGNVFYGPTVSIQTSTLALPIDLFPLGNVNGNGPGDFVAVNSLQSLPTDIEAYRPSVGSPILGAAVSEYMTSHSDLTGVSIGMINMAGALAPK